MDTIERDIRRRLAEAGVPGTLCGGVTAIQRASSDLRLGPHFHTLLIDRGYARDSCSADVVKKGFTRGFEIGTSTGHSGI